MTNYWTAVAKYTNTAVCVDFQKTNAFEKRACQQFF